MKQVFGFILTLPACWALCGYFIKEGLSGFVSMIIAIFVLFLFMLGGSILREEI